MDEFGQGLGPGFILQLVQDSVVVLTLAEVRFKHPKGLTRLEGSSSVKLTGDTAAVEKNKSMLYCSRENVIIFGMLHSILLSNLT